MAIMEINYLGHASFRLKGKNSTVITDPFNPEMVGLKMPKQLADMVTVSHQHPDHNYVEGVKAKGDQLLVFDAPGEYESKGIDIRAWRTFHDDQKGTTRGVNTVFQIVIEGVSVTHLGDLGHLLDDKIIEAIGETDVLMVPVGGYYTIDAVQAAK